MRILFLVCLGLAAYIHAGQALANFGDVTSAIHNHNWHQAAQHAERLDAEEGSGDFFSTYVIGARLTADGRCEDAYVLFSALLASRPHFVPALENIYICATKTGNTQRATNSLRAILGILPSNGTQYELVSRMLANEESKNGLAIDVTAGISPSTNANRQTTAKSLGGLSLAKESRQQQGVNSQLGVGLTKRLFANNQIIVSGTLHTELNHSTVSNLLRPSLIAKTNVTFSIDQNHQFVVNPFAQLDFEENATSRYKLGVNSIATRRSQLGRHDLQIEVSRIQYRFNSYLDAWRTKVNNSFTRQVSENTIFSASLGIDTTLADDRPYSKVDASFGIRLDHILDNGFILSGEGRVGRVWHNRAAPLTVGSNQVDDYAHMSIEISHDAIKIGDFRPVLTYLAQWRDSDNLFYDYSSHDFGLTFKADISP